MKKITKQAKLIELLTSKSSTIEEMLKATGLAKNSIDMYLKYYFKKIGYKVIIENAGDCIKYSIEKI